MRYVKKHRNKPVLWIGQDDTEICMPEPGKMYVCGTAIEKLAQFELLPEPGERIWAISDDGELLYVVESLTLNRGGWMIHAAQAVTRHMIDIPTRFGHTIVSSEKEAEENYRNGENIVIWPAKAR